MFIGSFSTTFRTLFYLFFSPEIIRSPSHTFLYLSAFTIECCRISLTLASRSLAVEYITTIQLIFYISDTAAHGLRRRAGLSLASTSFVILAFLLYPSNLVGYLSLSSDSCIKFPLAPQ